MPPDGIEILARWREAGAWWEGEQPREIVQWRDARGIRREKIRPLPRPDFIQSCEIPQLAKGDDYSLRPRKLRDEKVSKACGFHPESGIKAPEVIPSPRSGSAALLHALSGYSFGRSCLLAPQIAIEAAARGYKAAALVDRFSLAGAFEFALECRRQGIKPLLGAQLEMDQNGEIVVLCQSPRGWRSLCRIITRCHLENPRLHPLCTWEILEQEAEDLLCLTGGDGGLLVPRLLRREWKEAKDDLARLQSVFGRDKVFVQVERSWLPWGMIVEGHLLNLARHMGAAAVAAVPALHLESGHFPVQDALLCAHSLCTAEEVIGRKPLRAPDQPPHSGRPLRGLNGEKRLLPASELMDLYHDRPELIEATLSVADLCEPDVLPGRAAMPCLHDDPEAALTAMVDHGARQRWGRITPSIRRRLDYELARILPRGFSPHFLVAHDACRWARDKGILYSGRGSVVDSAVAYCLDLTRIDAIEHRLHFDRFLPDDGSKRPDIDIDFEAKRRDDVREHLTQTYGRDRVATVAAFGAYCVRGIIRELGKVLEIPDDLIGWISKRIHGSVAPDQLEKAIERKPELAKSGIPKERLEWIFRLAKEMVDIPRNPRCHSSGVVISAEPLVHYVPLQLAGVADFEDEAGALRIIQWDKRTSKKCFDKFDILCLRGQDVLSGTESRIRTREPEFRAEQAPLDDPEVYRTMRSGELIGVPQSASPAMRQAHIRLRTENLTDASLVQAGIRPGVGGAVKINELILRRRGLKPYVFEHPDLEKILGHTYGIVVFQEQIDLLLTVFAGLSAGEAEDIREEIHKRRREDYGQAIKDDLLARMAARGYRPEVAEHVFNLVAGFKGYGFAQGHALAFAEISVRSIYCQQNYPADYFASLFDAQPAGYYGPCTLANEARNRGVKVLPPRWGKASLRFEVEDVVSGGMRVPQGGVRVGLSQISGLSRTLAERVVELQSHLLPSSVDPEWVKPPWLRGAPSWQPPSLFTVLRALRPARDDLERLILAGFFDELHPNRRALLWALPDLLEAVHNSPGDLHLTAPDPVIPADVADFSDAERAVRERALMGLDVDDHLMAFERERVASKGGITTAEARRLKPGARAIVVGNPIRLRFPPTPSGRRVVFFDLEDESGLLNVTSFDETYQKDGHAIVCSPYVTVIGEAQYRDGHTAFLAHRVHPYTPIIRRLILGIKQLPVVQSDFLVG